MEGDWKFLGRRGILKANFLEEMYENKPGFPGGRGERGAKQKNFLWGEYGYFLELHKGEKKRKKKKKKKLTEL